MDPGLALAFVEFAVRRARQFGLIREEDQRQDLDQVAKWWKRGYKINPTGCPEIRLEVDRGKSYERILLIEIIDSRDARPGGAHYMREKDDKLGRPVYRIQLQHWAVRLGLLDEVLPHEINETHARALGHPEPVADQRARAKISVGFESRVDEDFGPHSPGMQTDAAHAKEQYIRRPVSELLTYDTAGEAFVRSSELSGPRKDLAALNNKWGIGFVAKKGSMTTARLRTFFHDPVQAAFLAEVQKVIADLEGKQSPKEREQAASDKLRKQINELLQSDPDIREIFNRRFGQKPLNALLGRMGIIVRQNRRMLEDAAAQIKREGAQEVLRGLDGQPRNPSRFLQNRHKDNGLMSASYALILGILAALIAGGWNIHPALGIGVAALALGGLGYALRMTLQERRHAPALSDSRGVKSITSHLEKTLEIKLHFRYSHIFQAASKGRNYANKEFDDGVVRYGPVGCSDSHEARFGRIRSLRAR